MERKAHAEKQGNNRERVGKSKPPKDKQWRPGQSGNLNGRPKKEVCLTSLLKQELERVVADSEILASIDPKLGEITWAQMIAMALIRKAAKGSERAAEIVFERTEGKVAQPFTGPEDKSTPFDYSLLSDHELELLRKLLVKATSGVGSSNRSWKA